MKLGVIGCGNMARAMVIPASKLDLEIFTYTPSFTKAEALAKEVGGTAVKELSDLTDCDYFFLGCKPQNLNELAPKLKAILCEKSVLISVLAGTSLASLKRELGISKIARVMPNTPSLIKEGVSLVCFDETLKLENIDLIKLFLESSSKVFKIDTEEKLDFLTSVSGSGPAYFFEIGRIFQDYLKQNNIDEKVAREIVVQTMFGSAALMRNSSEPLKKLRENVTSKNGVTFEALKVFEEEKLEMTFKNALKAAYKRTKELKNETSF